MQHQPLAALLLRAEANDPEAQLQLAQVLATSDGERGASWLRRSADAGNVSAGALLGAWLLLGHHVKQDEAAGVARLQDAAAKGDAAASAFLATLHAAGLAVSCDWRAATQWLIAAAKLGSDRAQTQLALLVGEPEKELRARLLFAAATRANDIAAYFMGKALSEVDRPDARSSAMLWFGIAAALGNPRALSLAPASTGALQLPPSPVLDDAFWSRVGDAVDFQPLLAAPSVTTQRRDPLLLSASRVLPATFCDYLIGMAAPLLQRAEVNDALGQAQVHQMRTNSHARFGLTNTDVIGVLAARRAAQVVGEPFENQEDTMILRYLPGETYDDHYDFVDPRVPHFQRELEQQGQRIATVLIYLNGEYSGGETEFPVLDWRYRGLQGDALGWRNVTAARSPDMRTLHAGRPPASGEKWLLSQWIRDRRQLGRLF